MSKIKEIAKEKSTWVVGVPPIVYGILNLVDAHEAEQVSEVVSQAGQQFAETGNWQTALGWLGMGLLGIFMTGRKN